MVAVVTDTLRKTISEVFLNQINDTTDSNDFYIGIGKSDNYNATDAVISPARTFRDERELRNNLQSIKKVEAASLVIPRFNWTAGTIFSAFSDAVEGLPTNAYYVLTSNNEVYICLEQARDANGAAQTSTIQPNYATAGVAITEPFKTSDGYIWKFLFDLSAARAAAFLSTNFMPIRFIDSGQQAVDASSQNQYNVQDAAIDGQILGVIVTDGGSGYSTAPPITFRGDGDSDARATATVVGGSITKIEMEGPKSFGKGFTDAEVIIGGSGTAKARAIISPIGGVGANPLVDLKASNIMLNIKPDGSVSTNTDEQFIIDNTFRQIGLFRNIELKDSTGGEGGRFRGTSARTSKSIKFKTTAQAASFVTNKGRLMQDSAKGVKAFVDDIVDSSVFYHQNDSSGFGTFTLGSTLAGLAAGSGIVDSSPASHGGLINQIPTAEPNVNPHSGELLYVESRAAILRDTSQQEDIKVIITV